MSLLDLSDEELLTLVSHSEDPSSIVSSTDLNALLRRHRPVSDGPSVFPQKILELVLKHFSLLSRKEETMAILCSYISDCPIGVADTACNIVVGMCQQDLRLVHTFMQHCSSLQVTAEIACRFASVITRLMRENDVAFVSCLNAGGVEFVVSLSKTDDILLQMVTLEFLAVFAMTKEGLKYSFTHDIPRYLLRLASGEETGSEVFIRSSALQIFADTCRFGGLHDSGAVLLSVLEESLIDGFLRALQFNLEESDESCRVAGINAASSFSSSSVALFGRVLGHAAVVRSWLSLVNAKVEIQAVLLTSLAFLLSHKFLATDERSKGAEIELKRQLFNELSATKSQFVQLIVSGALRPFPEIKQACYSFQAAMAGTSWGLSLLLGYPGFREHLTDLGLEQTRDGKLWKFAVVEAAAGNESLGLLSEEFAAELTRAVARGPFYVSPQLVGPVTIDR